VSIPGDPFVDGVSGAPGAAGPEGTTMTVTTPTMTLPRPASLRTTTAGVGFLAASAATAVAAVLHGAGVPLAVDGEMIPLAGFAQLTFVGAVVGGLILAVCRRRSAAPRRRFLQVTGVLTAASCLPSVALPPDAATKIALVTTHLVAAAIIVPVLARRAAH
jgi:hypothetical protein